MKHRTYLLENALRDVAEALREAGDLSDTTIRCAINDHLDQLDKDGFRVQFNYNQPRAIKRVKAIAKAEDSL